MNEKKSLEEPKFVLCSCWMDALAVWKDPDCDFWELAIWRTGRPAFMNRFRCAWRCLIHGTPYLDQVCLNKEGRDLLVKILTENSKTEESNEASK